MVDYSINKPMFVYANKDKFWLVWDGQPIEIKDYQVSSFNITIGPDSPCVEFSIDLIGLVINYGKKGNVDASDFYNIEECKQLSKVIQRKFDKILEKEKEE